MLYYTLVSITMRCYFAMKYLINPKIDLLPEDTKQDLEAWVVNTVKVKLIKKLDSCLDNRGKMNLRKLFLVPVFAVADLEKRVLENGPEMRTVFYKELFEALAELESQFQL